MHYNELQSRYAEVEAMAMKFKQRVADAAAKAGFRAKPGPQKGSFHKPPARKRVGVEKETSRWNSEEVSAPSRLDPMVPPWTPKKDEKYSLSTAMEV
jgi:hypothetical protein